MYFNFAKNLENINPLYIEGFFKPYLARRRIGFTNWYLNWIEIVCYVMLYSFIVCLFIAA